MEKIITLLVWATILQGLVLSVLFFTSRKHNSRANRLLGFFILCLIAEGLSIFLPYDRILGYPLYVLAWPEIKLFLPVLFFHYILFRIQRTAAYRIALWAMYGLGVAVLAICPLSIASFLFTGKTLPEFFSASTVDVIFMGQQVLAFILCLAVCGLAFYEVRQYGRLLKNNFSATAQTSTAWLWEFYVLILPPVIFWGAELIRALVFDGIGTSGFVYVAWLFVVVLIYYVSYKVFSRPDIFLYVETVPAPMEKNADYAELFQKLQSCMEDQRLFLNPRLTVYELSQAVSEPPRKISEAINVCQDKNFSEWVNEYRVSEAKKLFTDKQTENLTLEAIGLSSGFNSRSVFYEAFKKSTGATPGQYKKQLICTKN